MKYGLINNSDKAAIEMALREVDAISDGHIK